LLALQAGTALKRRLFIRKDVSIDLYDTVYNGERDRYVFHAYRDVKGKMRPNHRYGLVSVTGQKFFFALGILPLARGDRAGAVVDRLLEMSTVINPGAVLMDRGFYSLEVFEAVEKYGLNYIVPGKAGDRMDELYMQSILDGCPMGVYTMYGKAKRGRRKKELTVYFQEDPVFEYNSFFTNLAVEDVETLAGRYSRRGNIENNIKAKKHVKARTSSTHLQYRLFLETISLILTNLWRYLVATIQQREEKPMTQDSFNHLIQKILEAGNINTRS